MKSVSASFKTVWARKHGKRAIVRILYKRRYFDTATLSFKYEANWRTLDMRQFADVSEINWALDTQFLNVFRASNVSLFLNDIRHTWVPSAASPSVFAADGVAPNGYDPMQTKFQVQFGYRLPDGNDELVSLFIGVAVDYIFDPKGGRVEVLVSGLEYLLETADATKVSTTFTNESTSPAAGDGSNKEFLTTSTGVGRIDKVRVAGATQVQGVDYTITDLNKVGTPAKITFLAAPGNTLAVDASGIKWLTSQKIETLIGLLLDQAGILSADRTLNPVIFPGGVSASQIYDTLSDWQAGISDFGIDLLASPGDVRLRLGTSDDFSDGDYTNSPAWTVHAGGSFSVTSGRLRCSNLGGGTSVIDTPSASAYGEFEFDVRLTSGSGVSGSNQVFRFIDKGHGLAVNDQHYDLFFDSNSTTVYLRGVTDTFSGDLGSFTVTNDGAMHAIKITRSAAGEFKVYLDGVLKLTVTHAELTVSNNFSWTVNLGASATPVEIDNVKINGITSATVVTAVFDAVNPVSYGQIEKIVDVPANTSLTIETQTSTAVSPFNDPDGWVAVAANGQVLSAVRRYIKIRITLARTGSFAITPTVSKLTLRYSTAEVLLALANFTGKTVFQAIERLAQLANYEWGFTGAGHFFFRAKTVSGAAAVSISQANAISRLVDYRPGYAQVINVGIVYSDPYQVVWDSVAAAAAGSTESEPTSEKRFGAKIRFEDFSDILLANDADIRTARARTLYEDGRLAKRQFRTEGKIIPHLDLSDICQVDYFDHPLLKSPIWGDPLLPWGNPNLTFGEPQNVMARAMRTKAIGIRFKPMQAACDIIHREILQ